MPLRAFPLFFAPLLAALLATLGASCARVCEPVDFTCNPPLAATLLARQIPVPASGRMMVIAGGNTASTIIYDPELHTFSRGPDMPGVVTAGTQTLTPTTGFYRGRTVILPGGSTGGFTYIFDPVSATFSTGPAFGGGSPGQGGHNFLIPFGPLAGQTVVVMGGSSMITFIFDPLTGAFSTGPPLSASAGAGAFSFTPNVGTYAGMPVVVHEGGSQTTSVFNPNTITFFSGPPLIGVPAPLAGTRPILIDEGASAGNIFFAHGQSSLATQIYVPASSQFQPGPSLTQNLTGAPPAFAIRSGPAMGQIVLCAGGSTAFTMRYFPFGNFVSSGVDLPVPSGDNTPFFRRVNRGADLGQTIILRMGAPNGTVIHVESTDTFTVGTALPVPIAIGSAAFALP